MQANFVEVGDKVADHSIVPANPKPGVQPLPEGNRMHKCVNNWFIPDGFFYFPFADLEVSFALNLFPDGFSVGKAAEVSNCTWNFHNINYSAFIIR